MLATSGLAHVSGAAFSLDGRLPAGNVLWLSKFGTVGKSDVALELLIDRAGDVVLVGQTEGSLFAPNLGALDAFVVKFDVNTIPEPIGASALLLGMVTLLSMPRLRRDCAIKSKGEKNQRLLLF